MTKKKEILFDPFPKQIEFLKAVASRSYKFILYGGSIRGGKTYGLIGLFIILCKLFPGSKYVIVRKDLTRIRTTVLPTFYQIRPHNFTKSDPTAHNNWTWMATNGSQILFFAENKDKDPDLKRFRGLEYDSIGFEEMDIDKMTFQIGIQRCGTWKMGERKAAKEKGEKTPPALAVGTSNPQPGWVKTDIYDEWVKGNLKPSWLYIPSKVYDNPYVPAEWIETQKDVYSPLIFSMMIDGNWDVNLNENPWFYGFDRSNHLTSGLTIDPYETLYLSFDFNVSPCTCTVGQNIAGKGLRIIRVHEANGGTRALCDSMEPFGYEDHPAGLTVTGDISGKARHSAAGIGRDGELQTDYGIIKEAFGLGKRQIKHTGGQNPRLKYSRGVVNHALHRGLILFNRDECGPLINDLELAMPDKEHRIIKSDDQGFHHADNFRYLVHMVFPKGFKDINNAAELMGSDARTESPPTKPVKATNDRFDSVRRITRNVR